MSPLKLFIVMTLVQERRLERPSFCTSQARPIKSPMTPVIIQTQMGTTFVNHTHKVYLLQNRKSRPSYLLYYQNSHSTNVEGNMIIWLAKSTKINRKQQKVTKNVMIMQFKPSNKYALVQFLMTTTSGCEIFVLSLWQIYVLFRIFKFNQGLIILMRNRYTLNSFIHVHESTCIQ